MTQPSRRDCPSDDDPCFTCFIINTTHKPPIPSHPNFPTMQAYDCYGYPYYPHYPDYGTPMRGSTNIYTTHSSSSESDTIPLGYDESGYEHFHRSIFDGLLICSNSYTNSSKEMSTVVLFVV